MSHSQSTRSITRRITRFFTREASVADTEMQQDVETLQREMDAVRIRMKKHMTEIANQHHDTVIIDKPLTVESGEYSVKDGQIVLKMSGNTLSAIRNVAISNGVTVSQLIEQSLIVAHPREFYGKIKFD